MTDEFKQDHLIAQAAQRMQEMKASDPEIKARIPDDTVTETIQQPGLSYRQIIAAVLEGYAGRPALGSRHFEVEADPSGRAVRRYTDHFETITYAELQRRIEAIASLWQHDDQHGAKPGDTIAFIAFTGAEMATVDLACNWAQTVSVPLQANLPGPDMREILTDVEPRVLAASIDNLELSVGYALDQGTIRSIIVLDADDRVDEDREAIEAARSRLTDAGGRVAILTFEEAVARGEQTPWEPMTETSDDHVSMIMYTSGSTGKPKGAIIHDLISMQFWNEISAYSPTVQVAYAPMNHFMGRNMVHGSLAQGGTAYFTLRSDMSTLFDDFRIVRPTVILFIPRVCELVYQHYQSELQRRIARGDDEAAADAAVRAEMKNSYLGDRLCGGGVGSSPTAPEVRRFIAECFEIPFVEGYGQTEAGAAAMTSLNRLTNNMITEFRLVDVPELGYYTTDKPYPRGELYVKTGLKMFKGYFKRPEATAGVFSDDGFLKTGDIMEQRGPDHLVWVDRRGNVIKLSQAEFVAVGPLEATYLGNSSLIEQCFVYGSSYRSYLLAVVVPDIGLARAELGHEPSDEELRELVLREMMEVARKAELKNFEIPRDVMIEREPFTYENGLLSSARKPLRPNIKRKYVDRLEAMYEAMDKKQQAELARLREDNGGSLAERVAGAFKANLGLADLSVDNPGSYGDLGGDSLGAVGLSLLFEEMFEIAVPVSAILHPAASVGWLAEMIDRLLSGEGVQMDDVHPNPDRLMPADLKLHKFIDEDILAAASDAAPPAELPRTILLTGANGFLGRFLCLEWLEHAASCGGKVYCLARGKTQEEAARRLEAAFDKGDKELLTRYRELAQNHLEVLCGDLADTRLGLDTNTYARLAEEVDHIVHPAALVNHRLSYENLFAPNVKGTAELIALAIDRKLKRIDYTSTVGVPALLPSLTSAPEDTDVRAITDPVLVNDNYANGYAASKWAGEVLLREANALFGVPVNVFRPNMIMPHRRYTGQYNETDMITRLLFSIVKTGLAPGSFYELDPSGDRQRAHYDGLPVDFLAATMREIGSEPYSGFHSFNMVNTHDDGYSLDSFADWVESRGYRVDRVANHGEWLARFEGKLRNLGEQERQHSSIAILAHFAQPHGVGQLQMDSTVFARRVGTLSIGPNLPQLGEGYLHKYLDDMQARGLIKEPERSLA